MGNGLVQIVHSVDTSRPSTSSCSTMTQAEATSNPPWQCPQRLRCHRPGDDLAVACALERVSLDQDARPAPRLPTCESAWPTPWAGRVGLVVDSPRCIATSCRPMTHDVVEAEPHCGAAARFSAEVMPSEEASQYG